MTKFYIEHDDSQFVIDAENVGLAIAMFWTIELEPLRDFNEQQLDWVRWASLRIEAEYFIHHGQRDLGYYVHTNCAVPYLNSRQIELVVRFFLDQFEPDFVQHFMKVRSDNG
jgi:hypothetical protein